MTLFGARVSVSCRPVVDGVVVDGTLDGLARLQSPAKSCDHPVGVKGGGMVVVEGLTLLQAHVVVGGVVVVVGQDADVRAELLLEVFH